MPSHKKKVIHTNMAGAPLTGATMASASDSAISASASRSAGAPVSPAMVGASVDITTQEPAAVTLTKKQRNRIKRRAREEEEARKIAEMEAGLANSGTGTADGGVVNGGT
ncbi:hypothetical protein HDU76_003171, partial [Blyttiomyces sp. JEL0837]